MIVIGEHPRSWHCENNDCGNTSSNALFFLYFRSSDWKLKLVAPQVFKEIEMTIQAKPEEASKVSTNCLFQIYWSYINAWSKFKTNAGEHGLPVHHQTRRNASEALVWVSLARKANYFMYATLMLHLCVWILLDAFPSIGSSIQSSIFGGISSLCKPCGFSRLFGHLWWQGLLQAGESWCPKKQTECQLAIFRSPPIILPGVRRHESSEGSCSGKAESSWQFSAVAKAPRHLLIS